MKQKEFISLFLEKIPEAIVYNKKKNLFGTPSKYLNKLKALSVLYDIIYSINDTGRKYTIVEVKF